MVGVSFKVRLDHILIDLEKLIGFQDTKYDLFIGNGRQFACCYCAVVYDDGIVCRLRFDYSPYFFLCRL